MATHELETSSKGRPKGEIKENRRTAKFRVSRPNELVQQSSRRGVVFLRVKKSLLGSSRLFISEPDEVQDALSRASAAHAALAISKLG